jgi:hypothetical protein
MASAYVGDPGRLQQLIRELEGLSKEARRLRRQFGDEAAAHAGWWGVDDSYAKKAGPQWYEHVRSTNSSLSLVFDGLIQVIEAKVAELRMLTAPQDSAKENIAGLSGLLDGAAGGGTDGGRR